MEWSKAKKYTVIILILLNIVLMGLNIYKSFETRLTGSRISDVASLLNSRGVTITCSLPGSYKPMAEIATSDYSFDFVRLERIFMEGEQNVRRTDEYNSVVFISDNSRLSVRGSTVSFTSTLSENIAGINEARQYSDGIINKINENFGNYDFHSVSETDEGYIVKCYEKSGGKNVFSNFAYFTIKGNNVALALNYAGIGSEMSVKKNIFAADEALYSAINNIKEDSEKANISRVELGYYVISSNYGGGDYATPFYLITANGKDYYVNAYTGECF